jgi:hypothetical protein
MTEENSESLMFIPVALGMSIFFIVCLMIFKQIYDSGKIEIREKEMELGVDYETIRGYTDEEESELHN